MKRLGIIGCGHVVESRHLPALRRVPGLRVTALADMDRERLERLSRRWHVSHRFTDARELVHSPEVDAVAVCTPAAFHAPLAVETLEANKDLLVEKPLALSLDDCDLVLAAAEKSHRVAMVGFNLRWHRLANAARNVINKGELAPLRAIRSVFTCGQEHEDGRIPWRKRRVAGGGTLVEMAVHHYDLWRWLSGEEIQDVHAFGSSKRSEDDASVVSARLGEGILAEGTFGEGVGGQVALEIYGDKGRLEIQLTRVNGFQYQKISSFPGDLRTHLSGIGHAVGSLFAILRRWPARSDWEGAFIGMWKHFARCCRGEAEVGCTVYDGRRAVEVALAATASATGGHPVRVSESPRGITPPSDKREADISHRGSL